MTPSSRSLWPWLAATALLSGCAGVRLVDTEVRSFATPPLIPTGAHYRFERLLSQQADTALQSRLEALAEPALKKVGLQRRDATANYSVQVTYGMKVDAQAPWEQPSIGWSLGWGTRGGSVAVGSQFPMWGRPGLDNQPYYWRQVSLIIRHLGTQHVVYETHASHDGRWSDSEAVLPALFEAALTGFPNPPTGVRRINIDIAR